MKTKLAKCPMCQGGWVDEDGTERKPIRSRHHCEFCGSTGQLIMLDKEVLDFEEEEQDERRMASR